MIKLAMRIELKEKMVKLYTERETLLITRS
jgi:hypothetical protein